MPKQKKKTNLTGKQKIALAQHRNAFAGDLQRIIDKAVGIEIFPLIPKKEIDILYTLRYHSVRIMAPEKNIPADILKDMQSFLTFLFKRNFIDINIGKLTHLSFYEYFSLFHTIIFMQQNYRNRHIPRQLL